MTKSIDVLPTWYWPDGVARYVQPPRGTAYTNMVSRWSRRTPDAVAVRGTVELSYRELDGAVGACAAGLAERCDGSEGRPRVGLVATPRTETVIALLAGLYAGVDVFLAESAEEIGADCWFTLGDGSGSTVAVEELMAVSVRREASRAGGRLGMVWEGSKVFHPDAVVAGWALAFRTFMQLDSTDRFVAFPSVARWEGLVGVMAPMLVGATCVLPSASETDSSGALIRWEGGDIGADPSSSLAIDRLRWLLLSVDEPLPVHTRRQLARRFGVSIRTVLGGPGTGPIAATPAEWSIDAAVGIPFVGVDLIPLDETGRPAVPPSHLLAAARVGVKSTIRSEDSMVEGPLAARFLDDGVVDSGQLGQIDANGFLYLRGHADAGKQAR